MIHNVKDENLIKIQNLCHGIEQAIRKNKPTDAFIMTSELINIAIGLKVTIGDIVNE